MIDENKKAEEIISTGVELLYRAAKKKLGENHAINDAAKRFAVCQALSIAIGSVGICDEQYPEFALMAAGSMVGITIVNNNMQNNADKIIIEIVLEFQKILTSFVKLVGEGEETIH